MYCIDVVGTCNLKCPSCARRETYSAGDMSYKGLMDYDLFVRVLDKIEANRPGEQHHVSLFVWGEPLMHNRIGDMIAEIRKRNWWSVVSSNGNATKHLEAAIKAKPSVFSISLSGFQQRTYNATHYKGRAEAVTAAIFLAWNLIKQHSPETEFWIHFHLYNDNGGDLETLHRIVKTLDCNYNISIARILSADDAIACLNGENAFAKEKIDVVSKMIISPERWKELGEKYNNGRCEQIDEGRIVIRADGSVSLCCDVFGEQHSLAPSYLDTTEAEIYAARERTSFCSTCMKAGIPFIGDAVRKSGDVRQAVQQTLRDTGGDRFLTFRNYGSKNAFVLKGDVMRKIRKKVKHNVSRMAGRV